MLLLVLEFISRLSKRHTLFNVLGEYFLRSTFKHVPTIEDTPMNKTTREELTVFLNYPVS